MLRCKIEFIKITAAFRVKMRKAADFLSEKCAGAAFTVICYKFFNVFSGAAEMLSKAVNAEKFLCIPAYKLAVNGNIVRQKFGAALFARLVVCH